MTLYIGGRVMEHDPTRFTRDDYEVTLTHDALSAGMRLNACHRLTGVRVHRLLSYRDAQRGMHDPRHIVRLFDEMIETATAKRDAWLRTQEWRP